MSQSAEKLTTIVRALPPVVAGCRSSGGQIGGQGIHWLVVPLRTIRGRSPSIGRCLLFGGACSFLCALCRHVSPSVVGQWVRIEGHASSGGTGIEPATCGFGDPIRRVGRCRTPSPHAGLPHCLCRHMSPTVAACRRSLGHILGQPLLPRALFSLLCVADPQPYTPDIWPDPAAVPRRASAFSASHGARHSQV